MSKAKEVENKEPVLAQSKPKAEPWEYIGGGGRVIRMNPEDEQPRSPEEVAKVVAEADKLAAKKAKEESE
jgi:hypothetical protein